MTSLPKFTRSDLIPAGSVAVGAVSHNVTGPYTPIRAFNPFGEHGTFAGIDGGVSDDENEGHAGHDASPTEGEIASAHEDSRREGKGEGEVERAVLEKAEVEMSVEACHRSDEITVERSVSDGTVSPDGSEAGHGDGSLAPDVSVYVSGRADQLNLGDTIQLDMSVQRVFPNVTELIVEIAAPDDHANTCAATLEELYPIFQRALQEQAEQSSVKISLPNTRFVGPEYAYSFDDYIDLPNLKTAVVPPFNYWPVEFMATKLENLTFTAPDRRDKPNREHLSPVLISTSHEFLGNLDRFAKLKHFEIVCCSKDLLCVFDQWLMNMPLLESLSVTSIHTHTGADSRITTSPDNWEFWLVVTQLVRILGAYSLGCNPLLQDVTLDGMLFKPGELLKMVEKREKTDVPLKRLSVRCARMDAKECEALKTGALEFIHIRNHQASYKLASDGCDCPCDCVEGRCPERGWRVSDLNPIRLLTRSCTVM